MFVLDSVAPRAALRPPSDQAAWGALLGTVARRAAQQGADTGWQLPCPACMALVHGVASAQAAHDADLEAVLTVRNSSCCITIIDAHYTSHERTAPSALRVLLLVHCCRLLTRRVVAQPCRLVCFQRGCDDPPLYMPSPAGVKAAKLRLWELVEGIGPPELAAEAAGGALRRVELVRFGVHSPALSQSALPPRDEARERLRVLDAAASRAQPRRAASLHAAWLHVRPLFERTWADIEAELSRCEPNDAAAGD